MSPTLKTYMCKYPWDPCGLCVVPGQERQVAIADGVATVSVTPNERNCGAEGNIVEAHIHEDVEGVGPWCVLTCGDPCGKDRVRDSQSEIPNGSRLPDYGEESCLKKIRWNQQYYITTWFQNIRRVGLPGIDFFVEMPRICGMNTTVLTGEVSGTLMSWVWNGIGEVRADRKYLWPDNLVFNVPWQDTMPFPGELILVQCFFEPGTPFAALPLTVGYTWFETHCFTSGQLKSICRVDRDDPTVVLEERTTGALPTEWVGEEGLRYKVIFKGVEYLMKCVDFASYSVGSRVVIAKTGTRTVRRTAEGGGDLYLFDGCDGPTRYTNDEWPWDGREPVSDGNVLFDLDVNKHIVVPQTFYGFGA